jgi:hypothetical protein
MNSAGQRSSAVASELFRLNSLRRTATRFVGALLGIMLVLPRVTAIEAAEVTIRSTKDGTAQPAMFFVPEPANTRTGGSGAPLIVSLHSWSTGHAKYDAYESTLRGCQKRSWAFISPHFRGGNSRPEACGSDLAVQDVLDAVAYAQAQAAIDPQHIYAVGSAHMPLVLAHRAPRIWAGISAWLPITDLAAFHEFNRTERARYSDMVEGCCGGAPGRPDTDSEYRRRSPVHFLAAAAGVPIDINVGIFDGHRGDIVPVDQSLRAFNVLVRANGRSESALTEQQVLELTREARVPPDLQWKGGAEFDRQYAILLRRSGGPVRLTIYDGGHVWDEGRNGEAEPALRWIAERVEGKR